MTALYMPNTRIVVPKGARIQLTEHFWSYELDCKCSYSSCDRTVIDMHGVTRLELLRALRQHGYSPISAFRCGRHNADEGGKENSTHLTGEGFDIPLIGHDQELYWFCHLFNGVGDGRTTRKMIHGDVGHDVFTFWKYKPKL